MGLKVLPSARDDATARDDDDDDGDEFEDADDAEPFVAEARY